MVMDADGEIIKRVLVSVPEEEKRDLETVAEEIANRTGVTAVVSASRERLICVAPGMSDADRVRKVLAKMGYMSQM